MAKAATVPICDDCWLREEGARVPVRFREPERENCYYCLQLTLSGIYVRRMIEHG